MLDEASPASEYVDLPIPTCGVRMIAGMEPSPSGTAQPKVNQDRALAMYPFSFAGTDDDYSCGLFGVFDGHGSGGHKVSDYVVKSVGDLLQAWAKQHGSDPAKCLEETYNDVQFALFHHLPQISMLSGTTGLTCLIQNRRMYIANAGDSRAVLCRLGASGKLMPIDLTIDQKPDDAKERERIESMGGKVIVDPVYPARVIYHNYGLGMSRSIGDGLATKHGVICTPQVTTYDTDDMDACLVLASDGVWEVLSSERVARLVDRSESTDAQDIANTIVNAAIDEWRKEEESYRDDISIVVLMIHDGFPLPPAASSQMVCA